MRKLSGMFLSLVMVLSIFSFPSNASSSTTETGDLEEYYQLILDSVIEADGQYDASQYQLVDISGNAMSRTANSDDFTPNAIQVVSDTGNQTTVDTFLAYVKDDSGNSVNAFDYARRAPEISFSNGEEDFSGSVVNCTATYAYTTYRGNRFLFPTTLNVKWLRGYKINDLTARFYTLGDLYYESNLDTCIQQNFDYTLIIHQVNPRTGVTYSDTGYPEGRLIRMTDYFNHGSYISLIVDGSEMQYTIATR